MAMIGFDLRRSGVPAERPSGGPSRGLPATGLCRRQRSSAKTKRRTASPGPSLRPRQFDCRSHTRRVTPFRDCAEPRQPCYHSSTLPRQRSRPCNRRCATGAPSATDDCAPAPTLLQDRKVFEFRTIETQNAPFQTSTRPASGTPRRCVRSVRHPFHADRLCHKTYIL